MIIHPQKGFTVLELLVVIAIIGILTAVVLASVGTARTRGRDSAIVNQMASLRPQSELYHSVNNKVYSVGTNQVGACGAALMGTSNLFETSLSNNLAGLISGIGNQIIGGLTVSNSVCNASPNAWAVAIALPGGGAQCIDSTGRTSRATRSGVAYTSTLTTAVAAGTFVCL